MNGITPLIFHRTQRLLGPAAMEVLGRTRVIIFGIGGVGSWAAEALARTGVGHLTIVDADKVAPSNINRQAQANIDTIGEPKTEALARILRAVNPGLSLTIHNGIYCAKTAGEFDLESYDYVIDAIDSLADKALLILNACAARRPVLFSSMGAALKLDPERIAVTEFWKVQGCPLAATLRRRFKRNATFPRRKFKCVYSPELLKNLGEDEAKIDPTDALGDPIDAPMSFGKVAVNGSLCHITGIFGFTLAGLVVESVVKRNLPEGCNE